MAPVVVGAQVAAGVVGAVGAMTAASAAKATGVANQQGFNRAADVVEQNKEIVDAGLAHNLFIFDRNTLIRNAITRVNYMKSGVTFDGTPEDVIAENARLAQYERNVLEYNATIQKKKMDDDAAQLRYRGEVALMKGQNLATTYKYKAYGSLLGGAASAGTSYKTYYG